MAEHNCPFFLPQRSSKLSTSTTTVQNECELKSAPICSPRIQFGGKLCEYVPLDHARCSGFARWPRAPRSFCSLFSPFRLLSVVFLLPFPLRIRCFFLVFSLSWKPNLFLPFPTIKWWFDIEVKNGASPFFPRSIAKSIRLRVLNSCFSTNSCPIFSTKTSSFTSREISAVCEKSAAKQGRCPSIR